MRVSVVGSRTDVRKFDLTPGKKASFSLAGLPVGIVSVSADAFSVACNQVNAGSDATWYSEAVGAKLKAGVVEHVALAMIHNGKASVGVDFNDGNAPSQPEEPPLTGGTFSSAKAYMLPVAGLHRLHEDGTDGERLATGGRLVTHPSCASPEA